MENKVKQVIEDLIFKSNATIDSSDALKYSQAALNVAHAFATYVSHAKVKKNG